MAERSDVDHLRVEALRSYAILDTEEDSLFDALTSTVSRVLDVPISLVSLIDENRQWFKSRQGLDLLETSRQIAFCSRAIEGRGPLTISDAMADERFFDNPLVTGPPHIRFYTGVPLFTPDGHGLGTLCAIDSKPRELSASQQQVFEELGRLASRALELHRRFALLSSLLRDQAKEQQRSQLLTSMMVHDLRNPLAAIVMGASWGTRAATEPKIADTFREVLRAAMRMEALLGDALDICLAENGLLVPRVASVDLADLLRIQIGEQEPTARLKKTRIDFNPPAQRLMPSVDSLLMGRVLSNLLETAIKYAQDDSTIVVDLASKFDCIEFSIAFDGAVIRVDEDEDMPPSHEQGASGTPGYGLGLAFCRVAVGVHGGTIAIAPREQTGSRFILRLPFTPN